MDTACLPAEIILQVLDNLLPQISLRRALNLRVLCKALDQEVQCRLFSEGNVDEYSNKIAFSDCLTCHRPVRPERSEKAINRATALRYLVGLFSHRELLRWDMRYKSWSVLAKVQRQRDIREAVQQAQKLDNGELSVLSVDAKDALTLMATTDRPNLEARVMADVIVTLFGLRLAWSTLGPHYEVCGSQQRLKNKNVEFWSLLLAIHLDNPQLATKYLNLLRPTSPVPVPHRREPDFQWYQSGSDDRVTECIWIEAIAAGLTIAIRDGHKSMARMLLLECGGSYRAALASVTFFNGLSVLGTAFITISDSSVTSQAREVAIHTAERVLKQWVGHGTELNRRAAAEISHLAPTLFREAFKVMFSFDNTSKQHACVYILCQAAMTGDSQRLKFILQYMKEQLDSLDQDRASRYPNWPAPSQLCKLFNTKGSWTNENGISIDRLLNTANPYRIAAAQGHEEILKELFHHGDVISRYIPEWPSQSQPLAQDSINTMKRHRMRGELPCHPAREAVNDVFVDRQRLPNSKTRRPPNVRILKSLLDSCPKEMCWGGEVIACAGLSDNPEVLDILVRCVNLWDLFPEDDRRTVRDSTREAGKFVKGAVARTIGERALQHALRNGRTQNIQVLLQHGVRLSEGTKFQQLVFADDEGFVEEDNLHRVLVESGTVRVKSRIAYQKYFLPIPCSGTVGDLRAIEVDDESFRWSGGNKVKSIGMRTEYEELYLQ